MLSNDHHHLNQIEQQTIKKYLKQKMENFNRFTLVIIESNFSRWVFLANDNRLRRIKWKSIRRDGTKFTKI